MTPGERKAQRVVRFIERLLCHTKGEWAGRPFELADFQREFIDALFGTLQPDGRRQYKKALLGIPRKNGKSALASAVALYMLIADGEPGAEVYSAAADRQQARIVFGEAKKMLEAAPSLAEECRVLRDAIEHLPTGSVYRVLSSDAPTKHGLNPHAVIVDELHALPDRELWDVLTTAQAARRQPLTIAITTAGYDHDSVCFELYDYGRRLEQGTASDKTFLFRWYGAPDAANWEDETVWRSANPLLRDSPRAIEFLRDEYRQARAIPARQNAFRTLFLNQWVEQATRWLDVGLWDSQPGAGEAIEIPAGATVFGGLDLASVSDLTSLVWITQRSDGALDIAHRSFVPVSMLDRERNPKHWSMYRRWVEQGVLITTPGDAVEYEAILKHVLADASKYHVKSLAIDALFQGQWLGSQLVQEGLPVVAMRQGFISMGPAVQAFERRFLARELRHGGDPVLRWAVSNAVVEMDAAANRKVSKKKSAEKVDPLVALIMAISRFEAEAASVPEPPSIYTRRGLLVL